MKAIFSYIWQRRWCKLLFVGLLLFALPLLDDYVRQSIFGPKIDGIPWCVWEGEIRARWNVDEESWFQKLMALMGRENSRQLDLDLDSPDLIPVYAHLADDPNVEVRRRALFRLVRFADVERLKGRTVNFDPATLGVMRKHLEDPDTACRLNAAFAIWLATKDLKIKPVVLSVVAHQDTEIRAGATLILSELAGDDPDLFEPLSKLAVDPALLVRCNAVPSMQHFGKRAVPILRRSLRDEWSDVRFEALGATIRLGEGASEDLIPELLEMLRNEPDLHLRANVSHALRMIDPKRFAKPKTEGD